MSGYSLVVAGDDLDGHTILRIALIAAAADSFGGSRRTVKPANTSSVLVGDHRRRMIQRHSPIGHAERAAALLADAFEGWPSAPPPCLRQGLR